MNRKAVVLDASAVLCFLFQESGADRVEAVLDRARLSAVNYVEVLSTLVDRGVDPEKAASGLEHLDVPIVSLDRRVAAMAALLRPKTRDLGLSLGDRVCLALGQHEEALVLTADRAWSKLSGTIDIEIELIR